MVSDDRWNSGSSRSYYDSTIGICITVTQKAHGVYGVHVTRKKGTVVEEASFLITETFIAKSTEEADSMAPKPTTTVPEYTP